ncbi:MAG: Tellurium resistance protein TerA [Alphaproteobacteria bacterium]|nr:Tellurium resistance protein TerA [Alphaproteobacteria bacterium]
MTSDYSSKHSIMDATRSRAKFSEHGGSKGAAGFISPYDDSQPADFLSRPGQTAIVNPTKEGMRNFEIGVAWDNVKPSKPSKSSKKKTGGFFDKLLGRTKSGEPPAPKGVDLDLGCLYELENGKRGAIQAFGDIYGSLEVEPFIALSGDERTGDAEGEDEVIRVNGHAWDKIKRIVIYIYIYGGASSWEVVKPQIQVRVPEEKPMIVSLHAKREELALCAVAGLENIRGGIRMTNFMEYYPGHAEMDRAFGFGLDWADGQKQN